MPAPCRQTWPPLSPVCIWLPCVAEQTRQPDVADWRPGPSGPPIVTNPPAILQPCHSLFSVRLELALESPTAGLRACSRAPLPASMFLRSVQDAASHKGLTQAAFQPFFSLCAICRHHWRQSMCKTAPLWTSGPWAWCIASSRADSAMHLTNRPRPAKLSPQQQPQRYWQHHHHHLESKARQCDRHDQPLRAAVHAAK